MMELIKGYIQVYTGDGKGKTTCALGQGFRAVGNGLKVKMVQFLKSGETGELESVKRLGEDFKIYRFEKRRGFVWTLNEEEIEEVKKEVKVAFEFIKEIIVDNSCDILIIDEVMGVLSNKFLTEDEVLEVLNSKPDKMELILTGRNVPEKILERADLVTEMKPIKHYFKKGVPARKGIEY
ncbi:MAG: cob(I)yrinic acid a,c-diamide adenosyltransferase [Clostridium sp.]